MADVTTDTDLRASEPVSVLMPHDERAALRRAVEKMPGTFSLSGPHLLRALDALDALDAEMARLTAERDAAVARAEKAEADAREADDLRRQLHLAKAERDALLADERDPDLLARDRARDERRRWEDAT